MSPVPDPHDEARIMTYAAVIDSFGGPELLHLADIPIPAPDASEVQVTVAAAAVNPVDLSTRAGRNISAADARFPMVLGWDVAGTVGAVGSEVTDWQDGDRVAAMVFQPLDQRGTYAHHINIASALLAPVPDSLSLEQASTVPLAGLTAAQLLDEAHVAAGQTLLVDGPLGAVGRIVVALAVDAGVDVVGVVRPEQAGGLYDLGAALAVDRGPYTATVLKRYPGGVDAAIDLVGGATARSALDAVRDGGRYITSVPPYIDPTGPFETERDVSVEVLTVAPDAARLTTLLELAAGGVLHPTIEHTFPLEDATEAQRLQAAGGLTGRIVLTP